METRAHFALIGAFTLMVVAAACGFVFWVSGGGQTTALKSYRIVFNSSVTGLSRGSTVLFNGLRVGQVTALGLGENPSQVYAQIEVDARTPVKDDTKARLDYQGFTGVASVSLLGGGGDSPTLVGAGGKPATLYAENSDYQNVLENVQSLSAKAGDVLDKADRLLGDNSGAINETIRNAQTFSRALAANSDGIKDFMSSIADLGKTIKPLAGQLTTLTANLNTLVKSVDPAQVKDIVGNADAFSQTLAKNTQNIDALLSNAAATAKQLNDTTQKLDGLIASANGVVQAIDPKKLSNTVNDVSAFADTLAQNRQATAQIIQNTQQLTAKLNASADKIDGVLTAAQSLLGQPGTKGAFEQVSEAAQAIKRMADNLDARTKEISDGLTKFTGPGLRNYEALATDGRRTLEQINQTVRSLQRNPQQVIFGARPAVPEYGGH
jgi:phospholipid/cholesterol/gamma-HCH transport system substrate-binding protein